MQNVTNRPQINEISSPSGDPKPSSSSLNMPISMLAFTTSLPLQGGFVRTASTCAPSPLTVPTRLSKRRVTMHIDPSMIHHATSHLLATDALQSMQHLLAEAATATADTAGTAVEAAVEAKKTGLWQSFVSCVEGAIVSFHGLLVKAGIPGAYGISIILFTVVIKALTFPLNYKQMESTMRMQALSPRLRKLQEDYKDNPAVLNQLTAQLYRDEQINPLAGCLPVLAQIPVWIALYRSVLNLATDDLLNESFLWLPSLQGPVSRTGQGISTWLFPLQNGAPPIGWHDAICYLILPVILVATQFYSQKLIQPPSTDPQQQQATNFLKFMPLLIGWFALNVPSGLGVYWVTNNLLSTAQTLYIRSQFQDLAKPQPIPEPEKKDDSVVEARTLEAVDGFTRTSTSSKSKIGKSKKRRKRR